MLIKMFNLILSPFSRDLPKGSNLLKGYKNEKTKY